ncbi:MAG: rhamnulokinase [Anaerolineae bacterium]|nr:rhamnulokinase [Anaerolineae bacterium]
MSSLPVIAVDLGASSGRVMRIMLDRAGLHLEEVHRFPNIPVRAGGTLYWDALRMWHEIEVGIKKAGPARSISLDAWGVDFALLDRNGDLLGNPVHYRDDRRNSMMDWVFERVPRRTVFERTGIQFMTLNGLYLLAALVADASPQLEAAATFVSIADLFNYWLCGAKVCEFTQATTQQAFNPRTNDWDYATLQALGVPTDMFPEVVPPGAPLGEYAGMTVFASPSHDTASAVVAVPTTTPHYAYLSSGTWSLLGLEVDRPVITDASYAANVTNEGGYGGKFRLLKNVIGMWLDQQCRQTWQDAGTPYPVETLVALAEKAAPFRCLIDPDDPLFLPPGDMPARIREFCARSGQPAPADPGQVMRAIYESLAMKYRNVLERLIAVSGQAVERLHIIGGGSQNALLCQMTADVIRREVVAGPVEATALGNAIVQFIALGELDSVAQARELLAQTAGTITYTPRDSAAWDEPYARFVELMTTI